MGPLIMYICAECLERIKQTVQLKSSHLVIDCQEPRCEICYKRLTKESTFHVEI